MRCCASLRHSDLTNSSNRPPPYGGEGAGDKRCDMDKEKHDLKERMTALQKEADKIGTVEPEFDQKTFFDDLHRTETDGLSR